MRGERLGDRRAHPHPRVEGVVGILEHDLHGPPVVPQLPAAQPGNVRAVEVDLARRRGHQPEHRPADRALAGAALPHQAEAERAGRDVQAHPVHRAYRPEPHLQSGDLERAAIVRPCLSITGTDRSRSAVYGCSGADMI